MVFSIVQLAVALSFLYTIYWDLYILKLPGPRTFGGQWKFLTFWNLWIQFIYFTISFLTNILGSKASKLTSIRDYLFATLAFPIGQFVGIVFWVLFHLDRELVFPKRFDEFFPNYINHLMHTTIIPAQLLELILLYHAYLYYPCDYKKNKPQVNFTLCLRMVDSHKFQASRTLYIQW